MNLTHILVVVISNTVWVALGVVANLVYHKLFPAEVVIYPCDHTGCYGKWTRSCEGVFQRRVCKKCGWMDVRDISNEN